MEYQYDKEHNLYFITNDSHNFMHAEIAIQWTKLLQATGFISISLPASFMS